MIQNGKIWIFFDSKEKKQTKPLNLTQAQALILNLHQKRLSQVYIWTPGWKEWVQLKNFLELEQQYFVVPPSVKAKTLDKTQITQTITMSQAQVKEQAKVQTKDHVQVKESEKYISQAEIEEEISKVVEKLAEETKKFTDVKLEETVSRVDYGYFYPDFRAEQIDLNINNVKLKNKSNTSKNETQTKKDIKPDDRRESSRFNFKIEIILVANKGITFRSESENISLTGVKLKNPIPKEFLYLDFSIIIINKYATDSKKAKVHLQSKCVGDLTDSKRLVFVSPDEKSTQLLQEIIKDYMSQIEKAG